MRDRIPLENEFNCSHCWHLQKAITHIVNCVYCMACHVQGKGVFLGALKAFLLTRAAL